MGCSPSKNGNVNVVNTFSRPQPQAAAKPGLAADTSPLLKEDKVEELYQHKENQKPDNNGNVASNTNQVKEHKKYVENNSPKKTTTSPSKPKKQEGEKVEKARQKSAKNKQNPGGPSGFIDLSYEEASKLSPKSPEEMWAIVKGTSDKEVIHLEPTKNRKGWRTIRIFVSSTFKDFHQEREVLVKEVLFFNLIFSVFLNVTLGLTL